jgi:hypothetical protein
VEKCKIHHHGCAPVVAFACCSLSPPLSLSLAPTP